MSTLLRISAFALLLLGICSAPAVAQKRSARPKPDATHTLLWRISGNGLTRPSYIYGTMHVTDPRVFDFSDSVLLKLQECDAFAMEIILDSAARQIFKEAFSPDPTAPDIRDYLSDEQEAELDASLRSSIGFTLEQLAHARPWLLSFFLEQYEESGEESGSRPSIGSIRQKDHPVFLDAWLYRVALGEGKEIIGIESIDEQVHLFDGVPYDQQLRLILGSSDTLSTGADPEVNSATSEEDLGEAMTRVYHSGDLERLLTLLQDQNTPAFYLQRLLTDRNHTMANRIAPRIATTSMFIAVGAGHLPGPEGVLELLRKKGFSVTPVKPVRTGLAAAYQEKPYTTVWKRYDNRAGALSVELPGEPITMPDDPWLEGIHSHRTFFHDVTRGITYLTMYFDLPASQSFLTDEGLLKSVIDHLEDEETTIISSRPYDKYSRSFLMRTSGRRMYSGRVLLRGQRLYMVMAEGDWTLAHSPEIDRFTRSLALLDYLPSSLRTISSDTLQVEARLPSELALSIDTLLYPSDRVMTYGTASDTTSGYSYIISRTAFSRFYRASSPEALFEAEIGSLLMPGDSIHSRREIRQGDDHAVELEIAGSERRSIRRVRLVQRGGYIYRLSLQMPREIAYSPRSEEFFSSVRLTGEKAGDLFSSKLPSIVQAIDGEDTTLRKEAMSVLRRMSLEPDEIDQAHAVLKRPRADDGAESESLRYLMLKALGNNVDSTSLPVLRQIHRTLDTLPAHRAALRSLLADINTAESVQWLADLLLEEKVIPEIPPYYFYFMVSRNMETTGDTISVRGPSNAQYLFPRVLPLLDHPVYQNVFSYVLATALEEGSVAPSVIEAERSRILSMVTTAAADTASESKWIAVSGMRILEKLSADQPTSRLLRELAEGTDHDMRFAATLALIRLGDTVDPARLEPIAAAPSFRLDLYQALEKLDTISLFPRRYLTQRAISEAALADWLETEYGVAPDSMVQVAMREVTVDGERRRAYLFKVLYKGTDEEGKPFEEWTVGIGSLQPIDPETIDFTDEHAYSEDKSITEMTIGKHIDSLLRE